jgi:hypothetical protein
MTHGRINRARFPYVAVLLGGFLMMVLVLTDGAHDISVYRLPRLTLLLISEFGCIVTATGAWLGIQQLMKSRFTLLMIIVTAACAMLAPAFAILGVNYWPHY